eukprot:2444923-Pyramimonas_sp.AAC.1
MVTDLHKTLSLPAKYWTRKWLLPVKKALSDLKDGLDTQVAVTCEESIIRPEGRTGHASGYYL